MKKVLTFFKKRTWIFVLLACLLFIPQSFSYQAKLNMRVIVTGLAIDKASSGYEITAQVVMPSPGSEAGGTSARLDFISEVGSSVSEGVQKIAYKIGKMAGLSHTGFIMIGENMLEENLVNTLDYFARDRLVNPSVLLVIAKGNAKEMIKKTKDLELSVGVGLQKVFIYKQSSLNGLVMPVDEFINSSFSISGTGVISGITIAAEGEEILGNNSCTDSAKSQEQEPGRQLDAQNGDQSQMTEESSGGSSGGGQSSGSSSGGSSGSGNQAEAAPGGSQNGSSGQQPGGEGQGQQSARIKFYNEIYYFKDGKEVGKLDSDKEILGMYLAQSKSVNGDFIVENVSGDILQDAIIGLEFSNKKVRKQVSFENGRPVLTFNISIKDVQLVEMLNGGYPTINIYNSQNGEFFKIVKEAIKTEIENNIVSVFEKAKNDDVDIFNLAPLAYQTKTKEWKEFEKQNGDKYINLCRVKVNVDIKNIT